MEELLKMNLVGAQIVAGSDHMERSFAGAIDAIKPHRDGVEISWHHEIFDEHNRTHRFLPSYWRCSLAGAWIILDRVAQEPTDQTFPPFRKVNQYAIMRKAG